MGVCLDQLDIKILKTELYRLTTSGGAQQKGILGDFRTKKWAHLFRCAWNDEHVLSPAQMRVEGWSHVHATTAFNLVTYLTNLTSPVHWLLHRR